MEFYPCEEDLAEVRPAAPAAHGLLIVQTPDRTPLSPLADQPDRYPGPSFWFFQGAECPVCMAKFEELDLTHELPCSHLFHVDCLLPWLRQVCPIISHAQRSVERR